MTMPSAECRWWVDVQANHCPGYSDGIYCNYTVLSYRLMQIAYNILLLIYYVFTESPTYVYICTKLVFCLNKHMLHWFWLDSMYRIPAQNLTSSVHVYPQLLVSSANSKWIWSMTPKQSQVAQLEAPAWVTTKELGNHWTRIRGAGKRSRWMNSWLIGWRIWIQLFFSGEDWSGRTSTTCIILCGSLWCKYPKYSPALAWVELWVWVTLGTYLILLIAQWFSSFWVAQQM